MKKLFLSSLFCLTTAAFAQTVNDLPLNKIDVDYVQIIGTPKAFSTKMNIVLDFGQNTKFFTISNKEAVIKDANGKNMEFNSMMDALNFMSKNGFELSNAYALAMGNQLAHFYILKNVKNKTK